MLIIVIIIIIISKFIKRHVCLQKAAEALVWYWSDGLVTAIKQECLEMSFKTMFRIAQDDFCRQTVPNDVRRRRMNVLRNQWSVSGTVNVLAKSVVSLGDRQ